MFFLSLGLAAHAPGAEPRIDELPTIELCRPQPGGQHWTMEYFERDGAPCPLEKIEQCNRAHDEPLYADQFCSDCDYVRYSCVDPSWSGPLPFAPDPLTDCAGEPLLKLAFVVDGMGGVIRVNRNTCPPGQLPGPRPWAALVSFTGAGGTELGRSHLFERIGIREFEVAWERGVYQARNPAGWLSRSSAGQRSLRSIASRSASVIHFIGESLVGPFTPFGVTGSSGGSIQAASALWYDVGTDLSYMGLHAGGGIAVSLPEQCRYRSTDIRVVMATGDLCYSGDACGVFPDVAFPSLSHIPSRIYMDYVMDLGYDYFPGLPAPEDSCLGIKTGEVDPPQIILDSSFASTEWHGRAPRNVGFVVSNGFDNAIGATFAAGLMQSLIRDRMGAEIDHIQYVNTVSAGPLRGLEGGCHIVNQIGSYLLGLPFSILDCTLHEDQGAPAVPVDTSHLTPAR